MIRSASPSFCVRSTTPSSRNKLMGPLSPTGPGACRRSSAGVSPATGPREAPTGPGEPQEGVRAASSSFAVSAGQSCSAPPTVVSTSRSA